MREEQSDVRNRPTVRIPPAFLIVTSFLALRTALLLVRQPFFDELFTHWLSSKSFLGILSALRQDSGPPLFYFVVHMLGNPAIETTRVVSLVCAAIAISMVIRSRRAATSDAADRGAANLAAWLLAVFPPAVLFAVDARAYAMCAMLVTIGVLAVDDDHPFVAALAFVLAAYTHYYGVLFFPILLLPAAATANQPAGRRKFDVRHVAVLGLACLLFVPGLLLAMHQPAAARAWMTTSWPDALFVPLPMTLAIVGALALLASLRMNRYLFMVVVPLILALGLRVYVPLRFEAIVATPLALWLATSLQKQRFRLVLVTTLSGIAVLWCVLGILEQQHRPPDPYREAGEWVARYVAADQTVYASGFCYLETAMHGRERIVAFPPEQATHPGWRALPDAGLRAPAGTFFWVGERRAPELAIFVRERRAIRPLFLNDRAMVALVR